MSGKYAARTSVPSEKSRIEIEKILRRYGAEDFAYATSRTHAMIGFVAHSRQVRFVLPLPDRDDRAFTHTPTGKVRAREPMEAEFEQAVRQKWRALALMVKAKLEAVESGLVSFEQEFLPHIVLPGGTTVYEATRESIELAYETGQVRPLLAIEAPEPQK